MSGRLLSSPLLDHLEYLVMPFGLTNAPAVLQSLINDVLRDMVNQFVYVYLNDILIFSRITEEHKGRVRQVLRQLLENNFLRLKSVNLTFLQSIS